MNRRQNRRAWERLLVTLSAPIWLSASPGAVPGAPQDPWPVLDGAARAYARVRTLRADFEQVVVNPMLGAPDTTRGRLFQQRPSRFAMRFTDPPGDRIVADGRYLWLFTPSTTRIR
jgi:outer membrane lipoprotein-sorting protein